MSQIQKLRFREVSTVPTWLNCCWVAEKGLQGSRFLITVHCCLSEFNGAPAKVIRHQRTCEAPSVNVCFTSRLFSPPVSLAAVTVKTLRSLLLNVCSMDLEHRRYPEACGRCRILATSQKQNLLEQDAYAVSLKGTGLDQLQNDTLALMTGRKVWEGKYDRIWQMGYTQWEQNQLATDASGPYFTRIMAHSFL